MSTRNELPTLSIVMIVKNEAHQIERTLKKLDWADEIVVIDAFSTDGTMDVCRKYASRIYQLPWEGFSKQRQRSIDFAKDQWIFSIDADEIVSDELRREILMTIQNTEKSGFWVPRQTFYLGRWINHSGWFPDYQMRLFKRNAAFIEQRAVHEGFSVRGDTGKLSGVLYHYPYQTLSHHLEKINDYTTLAVEEKIQQRNGKPVHWYHLVFNPLSTFLRMFFVNKGYKDGFQGFILALFSAFYTQALYAKVWEQLKNHNDFEQ